MIQKKYKNFFVLLIGVLLFSCSSELIEVEKVQNKQIRVLSTTGMIQDIVDQIGGDRIQSEVLIVGEIDPHSYELVKGDDEKIDGAAIVFYNGLNLEHGASLQHKIRSHPNRVAVGDFILQQYPELILFERKQVDPHIWMDISIWAKIIDPIIEALSEVDLDGSAHYEAAGAKIKKKMLDTHLALRSRMQEVPESKRYLVTSHDAFGYFTRGYLAQEEEVLTGEWRKRFRAPEGLAPDGQLGVLDLQEIIDYLIEYQVQVVFPESNVSRDSLRKIVCASLEKGAHVRFSKQVLYGDCMGSRFSPEGTYLGMMEHNIEVLIQEWR